MEAWTICFAARMTRATSAWVMVAWPASGRMPRTCRHRQNSYQREGRDRQKDQARASVVHDCTEDQRRDYAADIEAGCHETEYLAERTGRGDVADYHVARRHDHAGEKTNQRHQ